MLVFGKVCQFRCLGPATHDRQHGVDCERWNVSEAPSGKGWNRSIIKMKGMLMSESRRKVWNVLALALQPCVYICLGVWIFLLSTICSSPLAPEAATGHVISYNCHGTLVFISRTQNILLYGLIPALVLAGVCGRAVRKRAGPPKGER
jgi:hypothetical protein